MGDGLSFQKASLFDLFPSLLPPPPSFSIFSPPPLFHFFIFSFFHFFIFSFFHFFHFSFYSFFSFFLLLPPQLVRQKNGRILDFKEKTRRLTFEEEVRGEKGERGRGKKERKKKQKEKKETKNKKETKKEKYD